MIGLFYGKNDFLLTQYVTDVCDDFVANNGLNSEIKKHWIDDDTDIEKLFLELQNVSLFSPKKLTVLFDISASKTLIEDIEKWCNIADENNWVVLVDRSLQARSRIVKMVEGMDGAVTKKADNLKEADLISWAQEYARQIRKDDVLNRASAAHLVERVGEDQQLLASEIKKIVNALDDNKKITNESIDSLVELTPQGSVFAMLDATLAGDVSLALRIYSEQVAGGSVPQQIFGMIVWQMTQLAIIVDARSFSNKELTDTYGISSYAVSKLRPIAMNLSKSDMSCIASQLLHADYQSRIAASADDAVEYIISFIATYLTDKKAATELAAAS